MRVLALLALATGLVVAGCGSDGSDQATTAETEAEEARPSPEKAVRDFFAALHSGDDEEVCATLTEDGEASFKRAVSGDTPELAFAMDCRSFARFIHSESTPATLRALNNVNVLNVEESGDTAYVSTPPGDVELLFVDSEWLVDRIPKGRPALSSQDQSDPEPTADPEPAPEPEPEPEPEAPYTEDDLEYKLAVIDGEATSTDDPVLNRYGRALDGAKRVCPDASRQEVSDQAVAAMQIVQDEGLDVSAMDMLQGVGEVRKARQLGLPCSEVFATMAVLMVEG